MAFGDLTTPAAAVAWVQKGKNPLSAADQMIITGDGTPTNPGLVTEASEFIRTYLSRNVLSQDYEDVRDGLGGYGPARFSFANFPVSAVLLVVVNGVTIPPVPQITPAPPGMALSTFPYGKAGYVFSPTQLTIQGYWVPRWPACVTLQYTAGYTTVPADLVLACLDIINLAYLERRRAGLVSDNVAGIGAETFKIMPMSPRTQTTLDRYKAVAPVSAFSRVLAPTQSDPATVVGAL